MYVVGLTGGIATGKTTVVNWLFQKNVQIIDADKIAREIARPNMPALKQIEQVFGKDVILEDGNLNRKKLGSIIFASEKERKKLDKIMQPAILEEIKNKIAYYNKKNTKWIVLDMPLLIEMNYLNLVDEVWLVSCSYKVQLERLVKRNNLTKKEANDRINSQLPNEKKKKYADIIINNDGSISDLYKELEIIYKNLLTKIGG